MVTSWRCIETGKRSAAYNMALDEALLLLHEAGQAPPTLRLYAWDTPTLSLGYAQNTRQEVELQACRQYGVEVVRRPTGGRAVLHDQEVTYSAILPTALAPGANTLTAHYRLIGMALEAALLQLELPVRLERSRGRGQARSAAGSPACFAALARYELSAAGKKIVGSAQKRLPGSLLQHGAIPLWLDRQRLFDCLRVPPHHRQTLVRQASASMTAVNEIAARPLAAERLHQALREGFAATFNIELVDAPLQPEEVQLADELCTTKYTSAAWNLEGPAAWRRTVQARDVPSVPL